MDAKQARELVEKSSKSRLTTIERKIETAAQKGDTSISEDCGFCTDDIIRILRERGFTVSTNPVEDDNVFISWDDDDDDDDEEDEEDETPDFRIVGDCTKLRSLTGEPYTFDCVDEFVDHVFLMDELDESVVGKIRGLYKNVENGEYILISFRAEVIEMDNIGYEVIEYSKAD